MAANDRVEIDSKDVGYGQLAPSKANQTNFNPGKATGSKGDQNWPKDFAVPLGIANFNKAPVVNRARVELLHRNIICDQTIPAPVPTGVRVETRTEVGVSGANVTIDMENPTNIAALEKTSGYDNIASS